MTGTTIAVGILLVALGAGSYLATGMQSPTALIPAAFGLALAGLGLVARNERRRKHAMHAAVLVGLLGLGGSARGLGGAARFLSGESVARPAAVLAQSVMAVVLIVYVALCIKSFLDARRNRAA